VSPCPYRKLNPAGPIRQKCRSAHHADRATAELDRQTTAGAAKLTDMLASASAFKACVGIAVDVICFFMALLSFRGISTPRLKASNAAPPFSTFRGTSPATVRHIFQRYLELGAVRTLQTELDAAGIVSKRRIASDGLEILHEASDRLCVIFPCRHPLAARRKIALADLVNFPLVLKDPQTSVPAIVDAAFVSTGRIIRPAAEATYMMTAVSLVRAGLGITILPASAKEIDAEPSLRSRPIDDARFSRTISLIKKSAPTLPPSCENFLKGMIGAMKSIDVVDH
jgi:DNA-binding transcriptional LysR family regulator